jgi:pimeloyl-ACP methyl ester carboxylesterase
MQPAETTITAGDLSLAVRTWGDFGNSPIIALHGWQDNAATFDRLAPYFPDYFWVIPDLPGHGRSEHRGKGAEYTIWNYSVEVMALAEIYNLDSFTLVGHSMGGGIASMIAGLFPERVTRLVLLDVIGTITTQANKSPVQLRDGIEQRVGKALRKSGIYPTREAAIDARAKKGITAAAAALLGERGIAEHSNGYSWCHDQRLTLKSLVSLTDDQVAAFLSAITCPVLLVVSRETVQREEVILQRSALVKNIRVEHLDGGHHQHLEEQAEAMAELVRVFFDAA